MKNHTLARLPIALLLVGASLTACGKKGDGDKAKGGAAAAGGGGGAAAAVNAKLPAGFTAVKFEERTITPKHDDGTITVVAPAGWAPDMEAFAGRLAPPSSAHLGFMTGFNVGSDCDGSCEPKDWKAVIAKKLPDAVPDSKGAKQEDLPNNGVIRWGKDDKSAMVYAAWYKDGDSNFHSCSVNLDDAALVPALEAFVEACKTMKY